MRPSPPRPPQETLIWYVTRGGERERGRGKEGDLHALLSSVAAWQTARPCDTERETEERNEKAIEEILTLAFYISLVVSK